MKRFSIEHGDGTVIVREFKYEGDDGSYAATLWIGNENAGQESDAMLSRAQVIELIAALKSVISD